MSITLKLIESEQQIENKILASLSEECNKILRRSNINILNEIKVLVKKWIISQPEIQSLLSSDSLSLIGQFGTTINGTSIVNAILLSIENSISVSIKSYNKKLKGGGIEINIQPSDFNNLLNLPQGFTTYRDGSLHWMDWLLNRGDEIIIVGYEYNPQTGLGRSKLGNMKTGDSFRVPPQFSGTKDNNFITRALIGSSQEKDIAEIFKKILGI